mmetsp:Transcript_14347/g.14453  ORF Transcript_14347/g.14453 Transcript_14347/m.14453 type:complete len:493 (+) Transcript_14347:156-1634(+)|eukprot:CAMPEP_0182431558 /NCGR_PEP_ID=MMETSP1167-20130531/50121_1 /TAXON_ID=2988 /ORGANISM="Mallomonas Sp, Strain CCMP3275" /LENGTH=492 /DNA_ID=CAMNT_0024618033 /DNA_START=14 /DNA_END=1492 /DNA_ORIENTATION=+
MDRRALKLSLFRELDEKFIDFEEVTDVFRWHTSGCLVQTELKLTIPVDVPGSVLSFSFDTKYGDISFGITFISNEDGENESVVDLTRIRSDLETIEGTFEVPRVGVVYFFWDNSFSWLTAKDLAYNIVLQQGVAINSADSARITSAQDIAHKIIEDDYKSKLRYEAEEKEIALLTEELPILEKKLAEMQAMVNSKKKQLIDSNEIATRALDRMIINEETKPGLYFRFLSRNNLSIVFSYLYNDKGVGMVCKYWLATIVKDITNYPPTSMCVYSAKCLTKAKKKPEIVNKSISNDMPEKIERLYYKHNGEKEDVEEDSDLGYLTPDIVSRYSTDDIQPKINSINQGDVSDTAQTEFVKNPSVDQEEEEQELPALDTLRWRQRRAIMRRTEIRREVGALQDTMRVIHAQLGDISTEKKRVRKEIIEWKKQFEKDHNRRANAEDKEAIEELYVQCNQCKYSLSKLEPQYIAIRESLLSKQQELRRLSTKSTEEER